MNDHNPHLDPELAPLATDLDRLGVADGALPEGLEQRVFETTLPSLRAKADQPRLALAGTPADPAAQGRTLTPLRLAAAVALMADLTAAFLANRHGHVIAPTAPIAATDEWAIMTAIFDDKTTQELDDLRTAATGLDEKIRNGITGSDVFIEEGS